MSFLFGKKEHVQRNFILLDATEAKGLASLQKDLAASKGRALVIVHPSYEQQKTRVQSLHEHSKETSFSRQVVAQMRAFRDEGIPLIVYVEADDTVWDNGKKSPRVMKKILENISAFFEWHDFSSNKPTYIVPTAPKNPSPLPLSDTMDTGLALAKLFASKGLTQPYIAGAYLRTNQRREHAPLTPVVQYAQKQRMQKEAQQGKPRPQHILERVDIHQCVAWVAQAFAEAGIQPLFTRTTTPDVLPSRRDLKKDF